MVRNVENEFGRWAPALRVAVFGRLSTTGMHGQGKKNLTASAAVDVLIVPDSLLARAGVVAALVAYCDAWPVADSLLVVDEAHRFCRGKSKRSTALYDELAPKFGRRVYMSGTPMPNRPMELYPLLSREAPDTIDFMDVWAYGRHYCAGYRKRIGWDANRGEPRMSWDFSGASNVPELRARVQGTRWPFMLRLRKELLGLPPKIEEVFIISADMSPKLARLDKAVAKAYGDGGDDAMRARLTAAAAVETGGELHTMTYRRLLGVEKVKPSAEYIRALLEETTESILVFAYHKEVVLELGKALAAFEPYIISGDTPKAKRQEMVDDFQASKTRRLVVGNYHAMGVGFTMTKATRVIFVEFDWVPGVNDQAGDRAHRIGQTKSVLVQYVVYKNSIDKRVLEAVLTKSDTTKRI